MKRITRTTKCHCGVQHRLPLLPPATTCFSPSKSAFSSTNADRDLSVQVGRFVAESTRVWLTCSPRRRRLAARAYARRGGVGSPRGRRLAASRVVPLLICTPIHSSLGIHCTKKGLQQALVPHGPLDDMLGGEAGSGQVGPGLRGTRESMEDRRLVLVAFYALVEADFATCDVVETGPGVGEVASHKYHPTL